MGLMLRHPGTKNGRSEGINTSKPRCWCLLSIVSKMTNISKQRCFPPLFIFHQVGISVVYKDIAIREKNYLQFWNIWPLKVFCHLQNIWKYMYLSYFHCAKIDMFDSDLPPEYNSLLMHNYHVEDKIKIFLTIINFNHDSKSDKNMNFCCWKGWFERSCCCSWLIFEIRWQDWGWWTSYIWRKCRNRDRLKLFWQQWSQLIKQAKDTNELRWITDKNAQKRMLDWWH